MAYQQSESNIRKEVTEIAILGSTGSIGTQTLDIIAEYPDRFRTGVLTAGKNWELLARQARHFLPRRVVIADEDAYPYLKEALVDLPIEVAAGATAIAEAAATPETDTVVTAMVGYSGLMPTVKAIEAGKTIALSNKETLVVAGEVITRLLEKSESEIVPVDSEHSAIFQCLRGETTKSARKIVLTASGGPFRTKTIEELRHVTVADALRHPNWNMGAKVTIDSASMMNKGFEMIEAKWLFDVTPDQVQVMVHPQSVIHSMVQFEDGAVIAQLGIPDMKLPIAYAFSFPTRMRSMAPRLDFNQYSTLTFEEPDMERFRNLAFAFEAARQGGNMPCILNAANEMVVAAFLQDRIGFLQMSDVIERTMRKASFIANPSYEDYVATDTEARRLAAELF